MKASIIIPTHNRVKSLLRTIKSVCRLNFPPKDYEIIIVENACMDSTKSIIEKWIYEKRINNMKVFSENTTGVHFARNTGAHIAKGEVLVFIDDDILVSKNFLNAYVAFFKKYPGMVAAGGEVLPEWETEPPKWLINFIDKRKTFFILGLMSPYNKFRLAKDGFFFSNNMAIKKEILFQMGGFNPELIGNDYVGNGEAGLNQKLWENGRLVGYVPEALVYHHISKDRMTVEYFIRRMKNEGASGMYGKYHKKIPSKFRLYLDMLEIFINNLRVIVREPFVKGQTDRNALLIQMEKAKSISELKYIRRLMTDPTFRKFVLKEKWLE